MPLNLSPEMENVVRQRAAAEGVTVDELLARTFAPVGEVPQLASDPQTHVRALLARWQAEDKTPTLPAVPTRPGETPTEALFRKWEEEDVRLADDECQAEDQLWEDFQQGIDEERARAGMRTLF